PEPHTLSLHDALPISTTVGAMAGDRGLSSRAESSRGGAGDCRSGPIGPGAAAGGRREVVGARPLRVTTARPGDRWIGSVHDRGRDRKSTRLNSSHVKI